MRQAFITVFSSKIAFDALVTSMFINLQTE